MNLLILLLSFAFSNLSSTQSNGQAIGDNPQVPPTQCQIKKAVTAYVDGKNRNFGDGSRNNPFQSINVAIDTAAQKGVCHLQLEVVRGEYKETVINKIPRLRIAALSLPVVIDGGVVNESRDLELQSVILDTSPTGVGLRQHGGRLKLLGVVISNIATTKSEDSGIGLWLSGGVNAVLGLVVIRDSGHQGIRIEGDGTRVWANLVLVQNTEIHPAVLARILSDPGSTTVNLGAVQVTRFAELFANGMVVQDSKVVGILVDASAQMGFHSGLVRNTRLEAVSGRESSAANIQVMGLGVADVVRSSVLHSDLTDFAAGNAFLSIRASSLDYAPVGFTSQFDDPDDGYDPGTCARLGGTQYLSHLGVPFYGTFYTIGRGDESVCRRVPMEPAPF